MQVYFVLCKECLQTGVEFDTLSLFALTNIIIMVSTYIDCDACASDIERPVDSRNVHSVK